MFPESCKKFLKPWIPRSLRGAYHRLRGRPIGHILNQRDDYPQLKQVGIEELFPGIGSLAARLPLIATNGEDSSPLPPRELAVLGAICLYCKPRRVFEIGTYQGGSTLVIALNTPEDTVVYTLDLDASARQTHKHGLGTGGFPQFEVGSHYRGSPVQSKVRQLLGNSATYNFEPFLNSMNLVLVDADHTYEFVQKDTRTALALLAPLGIILWDDYIWTEGNPECAGVTRSLNELARSRKLFQIEGTRLAFYRAGGG